MEEINYEIERQGTVKAPSTRAGHSTNTKPYVNQILVFILSHSHSSHLSLSLSRFLRREITNRSSLESKAPSPFLSPLRHLSFTSPHFPSLRWRKEAYSPREYDSINEYVPTSSIDVNEGLALVDSIKTNLDGYIGPAYNFDDQRLADDWMLNFKDSMVSRLSESDFVRIQLENLMEALVNKVQDQVCNDLKVLVPDPVGLGPRLIEQPVWGIDNHTLRTIQIILEDYYSPEKMKPTTSTGPGRSSALSCPPPPCAPGSSTHSTDHYSADDFKKFLERTLLPTINFVPSSSAHSMKCVLETIEVSLASSSSLSLALLT
jgi:hypothetical protein